MDPNMAHYVMMAILSEKAFHNIGEKHIIHFMDLLMGFFYKNKTMRKMLKLKIILESSKSTNKSFLSIYGQYILLFFVNYVIDANVFNQNSSFSFFPKSHQNFFFIMATFQMEKETTKRRKILKQIFYDFVNKFSIM